jgi:hypothetical protein
MNTASVASAPPMLQQNEILVIPVSLAATGRYYTSFARLCNHRPLVSDMCAALLKAGALHSLATSDFANTVFWPGE